MTDLLERVLWIKDAVSGKDLGLNQLSSYYLHAGFCHASDGRMVVGTPFPIDGVTTALVPAESFLKVLANKPPGTFSWELEPDRLVLKRGRFKGKVKLLDPTLWVYPLNDIAGGLIPEGLLDSFRVLLPFVSENATKPWATCILAQSGCLYASNNIVVARSLCPSLELAEPLLFPRWVAEFILQREEGLEWWHHDPVAQHLYFGWEDGSWMRSSLIIDKYPPVESVLGTMFHEPTVCIDQTWREALLRVGKITGDPVIRLRTDGVYGAGGETVLVEDEASTPVPEGLTETVWDLRFLESVLEVATHWDPTTYPKPAPWKGSMVEGIIMGRRDT